MTCRIKGFRAYSEIDAIAKAANSGSKFCALFEYIGANCRNKSGESRKFWCVERTRVNGPLQVRNGRITLGVAGVYGSDLPDWLSSAGGRVSSQGISWADVWKRAMSKAGKGYSFVRLLENNPVRAWAQTMPAPFNTISVVDSKGRALDSTGSLVCVLPPNVVTRIGL